MTSEVVFDLRGLYLSLVAAAAAKRGELAVDARADFLDLTLGLGVLDVFDRALDGLLRQTAAALPA
jgi:hypothetical protein